MENDYAIVQAGGSQLKLSVGQSITIDRQSQALGEEVTFEKVLCVRQGDQWQVGRPWIAGAKVVCQVRAHRRGPKLTIYKFRRRENYRRTIGHRSDLTDVVVKEIRL